MSVTHLPRKNIVVIGAGVVGLSTAIRIQERGGYQVSILAEVFPTDPKCIKYTSHWAGAHHVCAAAVGDSRQQKLERETFDIMWEMSDPGSEAESCFLRASQIEYYTTRERDPDLLSFSPSAKSAVSFSALNINTPTYLPYLLARFLRIGGHTVRASVQHVAQVLEGGVGAFTNDKSEVQPIDALIICAGLGARTLGGVEDKDVYPVRGQTVLLRAPWIKEGRSLVGECGSETYIIPRRGGTVIVGGTRLADDWYPIPRPETTIDILERGLALYSELAPPSVRAERKPTVEDLKPLIIEEGCGLRPARKGGIRLQSEWVRVPGSKQLMVPIIYNYGHAAYGFQTSWGSASVTVDLLEDALAKGSQA
ncbi:nucleotide-binding domain-containing protein [Russula dissimulans]|nr:nucleotide-binding domain-containing protein [Russula dissimulans]